MGLGVREAVLVFALSSFMPLSLASTIAVFLRISFIAGELLFLCFILLFQKTHKRFLSFCRIKFTPQFLILFVSFICYIVYFTYFTFEKYLNFFTGRFDLGNMDQTVWNTLNGRFFLLTNPDNTNIISRLAIHSDFFLILLAPFYLIWNDPRMLLLLQTIVIASGSFFVYFLANEVLKDRKLSLLFGISFLLNPLVQQQNLYDFHSVSLATTFFLAAFYFLIKNSSFPSLRNRALFLLFIFLAVLTKETVFIPAGLLMLYSFVLRKKKIDLFLAILFFVSFYILVSLVIPYFRGGKHFALSYYQDFGESPISITFNILRSPFLAISKLFTNQNLSYLFNIFLTNGFLPLLSPLYLAFLLPDLSINLLSTNINFKSIYFQYQAIIIPFLFIASVFSAKKIIQIFGEQKGSKAILYYLMLFTLFSAWYLGPLPGARYPALEVFTRRLSYREEIDSFLKKIPQRYSIAATNNLGSHLSHRTRIYTIPNGIDKADVVLFLLTDDYSPFSLKEQEKLVKELRNDKNFLVMYEKNEFIAFLRVKTLSKKTSFPTHRHMENTKMKQGHQQEGISENRNKF
jgi:uncharacterized membrane protein